MTFCVTVFATNNHLTESTYDIGREEKKYLRTNVF